MKHIKPINEFFDFFKKDEMDLLAIDFIKRLEKIKKESPYEIKKIDTSEIFQYLSDLTDSKKEFILKKGSIYKIIFDDVPLVSMKVEIDNSNIKGIYGLIINDEKIKPKVKYKVKIYDLMKSIYENNERLKIVNRVRKDINPSADLL